MRLDVVDDVAGTHAAPRAGCGAWIRALELMFRGSRTLVRVGRRWHRQHGDDDHEREPQHGGTLSRKRRRVKDRLKASRFSPEFPRRFTWNAISPMTGLACPEGVEPSVGCCWGLLRLSCA
jgi:hypothetical protein